MLDSTTEIHEEYLPGDRPTIKQDFLGKIAYTIPDENEMRKSQWHNHAPICNKESDEELLCNRDVVVRNSSDTSNPEYTIWKSFSVRRNVLVLR